MGRHPGSAADGGRRPGSAADGGRRPGSAADGASGGSNSSGRGCDEGRKNINDEEQGVCAALQGKEENTSFIFFFISFDD